MAAPHADRGDASRVAAHPYAACPARVQSAVPWVPWTPMRRCAQPDTGMVMCEQMFSLLSSSAASLNLPPHWQLPAAGSNLYESSAMAPKKKEKKPSFEDQIFGSNFHDNTPDIRPM